MTGDASSSHALPNLPVGNDIVDLADRGVAEKHLDRRFVSRVLTERERRLFDESADPRLMLWSFW
ncbi:MAG TPA: 4'-phosphopantetheinyl transferase superfamily protein, partial [Deltaproteobacteria bacterium]|nr:4'-phosphopantetheinyl transferase superfamily protein [Deltaproteobacteria bacterium]